MIAFLVWMMISAEAYYRRMLGSEDFYLEERVRFESEGKKFAPNFASPKAE